MKPDKFLRGTVVTDITGVKRSSRYEMIAKGEFPRPVKIGPRLTLWSANEIDEWLRQQIARRDHGDEPRPRSRPRKASTPRAENRRQPAA